MREFKFRIWDIERERMAFFQQLGVSWFYEDDYRLDGYENKDNLDRGGIVHDDFLDKEPKVKIMQYTGLKDKSGKEIYEGDIISTDDGLAEVKYDENVALFMMEYNQHRITFFSYMNEPHEKFEVVGNVFDMPDWDF